MGRAGRLRPAGQLCCKDELSACPMESEAVRLSPYRPSSYRKRVLSSSIVFWNELCSSDELTDSPFYVFNRSRLFFTPCKILQPNAKKIVFQSIEWHISILCLLTVFGKIDVVLNLHTAIRRTVWKRFQIKM
jgi:hypothetical protein